MFRTRFSALLCTVTALSSLCACDALFEEVPRKPPAKPITVTAESPRFQDPVTAVPVAQGASGSGDCASLLQTSDNDVKIVGTDDDGALVFEIQSRAGLSEEDAARRASALANAAYGEGGCPDRKLKFRADGEEGSYFEGALSRGDYELYRQGRISRAELARRFELRKLETLASVKLKLKRARERGDHGFATILVRQWLEKDPGNAVAEMIAANVELDKQNYQEAAEAYENVLLTQPANFLAWFNLAYARQQSGVFDQAIGIYRKLIDEYEGFEFRYLLPEDVRLHLADALLGDGRSEEAQTELDLFPDKSLDAWILLDANAKRARKKYAEARGALENYLKTRPDSDVARFNLVLACLDLQDKDGARREFAALRKINPDMADEIEFLPIFTSPGTNPAGPKEGL